METIDLETGKNFVQALVALTKELQKLMIRMDRLGYRFEVTVKSDRSGRPMVSYSLGDHYFDALKAERLSTLLEMYVHRYGKEVRNAERTESVSGRADTSELESPIQRGG